MQVLYYNETQPQLLKVTSHCDSGILAVQGNWQVFLLYNYNESVEDEKARIKLGVPRRRIHESYEELLGWSMPRMEQTGP